MARNTVTESRLSSSRQSHVKTGMILQVPRNAAQALDVLGLAVGGIYMCRNTSGALAEADGGTPLAAGGAPVYNEPCGDRIGIRYPAGASHSADVAALGVASGWYAAVFSIANTALLLPGFVGRANAAFNRCAMLYGQAGGTTGWSMQIRDGVAPALTVSGTTNISTGTWLAQLQVDRAANTARARMSRVSGGTTEAITGSIAGFATLDGVAVAWGHGALAGGIFTGGATVGWSAWATGVQCEGASFLATNAQRLGVE